MKKKDILFLCQFFYPEHNSSAMLPFDTAKFFANHGFSVDALCGYPKEYCNVQKVPIRETKDGVGIRRLRYIQMKRGKRLSRLVNYFSFTASAFFHLPVLRNYKSVIVYSNPPVLPIVPVIANMLYGIKINFVAYDVYPEVAYVSNSLKRGSIIDHGMRWINHLLYKRAFSVVALTNEMKQYIAVNRPEIAPEKIVTIANWAHEKRTEPTLEAYERFGYRPDQFIVAYFGNMGICQEMDTLIGTVDKLRDKDNVRFLFVGHGSKKGDIATHFRQKHLANAQMLDFLTGETFEQAVAISSCCVVSLEKGLKGMCAPSKFYSYMQGEKPIIAVVEDGSYLANEIESRQIGYKAPIGDSDGLAMIIENMASHPEECKAMGQRAYELYMQEYSLDIGLCKYFKLFNELLKEQ